MSMAHEAIYPRRQTVPTPALEPMDRPYFDVYRADRVSVTSTLSSGGDWRWRFRARSGATIAGSGGYVSEAECVRAVEALQKGAGTAVLRTVQDRVKADIMSSLSARA